MAKTENELLEEVRSEEAVAETIRIAVNFIPTQNKLSLEINEMHMRVNINISEEDK